jgi:ankyrin repeat protein
VHFANLTPGQDSSGKTALILAVVNDRADIIHLLVAAGADPNLADSVGLRAIHWAVKCGHHECLRKVIDEKADIEARDAAGRTPLSKAVTMGDMKAMHILLESGADRDSQDCDGRTAVYVAARRLAAGDPTPKHTFAEMIHCGVNLDKMDRNGRTVTNFCTLTNKPDILKILVDAEEPPNFEIQDSLHRTALDWAVYRKGRGKCANLLEQSGALQYERHAAVVGKARDDAAASAAFRKITLQMTLGKASSTKELIPADRDMANKFRTQNLPVVKDLIKKQAFRIGGSGWKLLFRKYDNSFDGALSMEGLRVAIRRDLQMSTSEVSQKELIALFNALDKDGSGAISIEELIQDLDETLKGRPRTPEQPTYRDTRGREVPAEIANFNMASTDMSMSWRSQKKGGLPCGHKRVPAGVE